MDANNIEREGKELATKLASTDQIDFDYAINQYFESNAGLRTTTLDVHGVSKIKKILALSTIFKKEGRLVGQPRYDSKHQQLAFQITNTFATPKLPAFIPFHAQLSGVKFSTTTFDHVAHLASNGDEQGDGGVKGQKLFVTKLELKARGGGPVSGIIGIPILRPFISLAVVFAASALAFTKQHKSDNPIQFILAAVAAVWAALWDTLMAESSKRQAQAEQWREKTGPQLKQLYDQALSTASRVQADLEARTKSAGIPLDDYKSRASQIYADLSDNVEARAKAAGVPVDEYKKQAAALLEDLKKRAAAVGQEGGRVAGEMRKKGEEGKKRVEKEMGNKSGQNGQHEPANSNGNGHAEADEDNETGFVTNTDGPERSHEEIEAEFSKVPHTPLGGHDPTAPNAPSFALAAQL